MKIVTFSTLYPSAEKPGHGIFVETRLRHLVASGKVEARVVAPVPWFPSTLPGSGRYAGLARIAAEETLNGLRVSHPRYAHLPKLGMSVAPFMLARCGKRALGDLLDQGYDFDLIDAHYFYPDGVAAAMLGRYFNKPVVITARGSDISLLPRYRLPRAMIRWAAGRADAMVAVCQALKSEMVQLGLDGAKVTALRNGVDLQRFRPGDRVAQRRAAGLDGFTLLAAGHLVPVKGLELSVAALPLLDGVHLLVAGAGPERGRLEAQARQLGVRERVRFLGAVAQTEMVDYYGAADALVLASSREGWANVLLESMACGTPVIAFARGSMPELIEDGKTGFLVKNIEEAVAAVKKINTIKNSHDEKK